MDIPNLSQNPQIPVSNPVISQKSKNPKTVYFIIIVLAIVSGFWVSRFWPLSKSSNNIISTLTQNNVTPADSLKSANDLVVGQSYGDTGKTFTDTATGTIVKGGINGEGTHTLQREGGKTQNAALTSSTVDLDLFLDKKVEIKGETNSSTKAGWFLDVGIIKILE
ncbi:MAG: hypothetical protein PHE32_02670 [Candidatus Shapirobacteria bacterium]|nr:hypothetical protein [Candidatus Shapirobacteria bacterium]MDD4410576.1 hypothetical protein [Candidatus Shapirobacteria bacterium]